MWAAAAVVASGAFAQQAPPAGPGWTGLTHPEDVILARQELMIEAERLMRPIDSFTAGEAADESDLRSAAETIHHIMLAVPHLFPPPTNRHDPTAAEPVTLALPAIWQDFAAFYALATAASHAATTLAGSSDAAALVADGRALRAACDGCHAPFLRPYVPAQITEEDLEFDFDSIFEGSAEE